jgi:peptidyl-prolyl cis-trans isomerase SurA
MIKKKFYIIYITAFFLTTGHLALNAQERIVDQIVAVIGNSVILQSEIENELLQMQAQGFVPTADSRCELLESHLVQKLLLNQAIVDSIEVSELRLKWT